MRVEVPGVAQPGGTLRISYDGRTVEAAAGDTLAAALTAAGHLALRESNEGGHRGVFCGMGACHECAVVVDGDPGRLACMVAAADGMAIDRQPARVETPVPDAGVSETRDLSPAVLVVGGGPAGLTAAAAIAEAGVEVVLVDERSKLGGQFYKQPAPDRDIDEGRLDGQYRAGRALLRRVREAGVRVVNGVTIWGAFRPDLLTARSDGCSWILRPERLVLATGAHERAVPIPGWTLPGVMTTGAAQTLLRSSQVAPGERVVLSGNGPLNMQVAAELVRSGVTVTALVEQADLRGWKNARSGIGMLLSAPELVRKGIEYRATLARARVPVIDRSSVVDVLGEGRVEAAVVARLDPSGYRIAGTEREMAADAVCLGYGFIPANEIPRALGCDHHVDRRSGNLVTTRSDTGRTSVQSVWVVGDAGGVKGAYVAGALGALAAADILADLGVGSRMDGSSTRTASRRSLRRHTRFQSHLESLYRAEPLTTQLARDTTLVCRCESVPLGELRSSFGDGAATAGAAKRLTRAGMGKCQGRYCSPSVLALAAEASGMLPEEFSGFAPQAPVRPVFISEVASSAISGQ
ncbi:MAG: FAD-dependent oxidoreductase [bacterium]|nr:FAD-dependent oxidoreductase [bacterium]